MKPTVSIYSYCWQANVMKFDIKNALDNWALYSSEIVIAVNTSTDGTYETIEAYAREKGYPVKLVRTEFDFDNDGLAYGKVVNAALQACTGQLLIAQDLDERLRFGPEFPSQAHAYLTGAGLKALMTPNIDLYGDVKNYCRLGAKWQVHLPGIFRGPVRFGLKADGRPDYNKTSTDEAIDEKGQLVSYAQLFQGPEDKLIDYVNAGMLLTFHLGYTDLRDRIQRAAWWGPFWSRATGGDPNGHSITMEELLKRETKPHNLPLWEPQP